MRSRWRVFAKSSSNSCERDRLGEIITAVHHIPAREAKFSPMPEWVRPELARTYAEKRRRAAVQPPG
jgi:hypothetical protein